MQLFLEYLPLVLEDNIYVIASSRREDGSDGED